MSVRLRRLMSDYEKIMTEFSGHKYVIIKEASGNPPENYRIEYKVKGLQWDAKKSAPFIVDSHLIDIYLPSEYPRTKPRCTLVTPIFHPNISSNHSPDWICIGDYWAPASNLMEIIVKIGEMIQLRDYNVKSPLNSYAAQWVKNNEKHLPVGNVDMYQPEAEIDFMDKKEDDLGIVLG